MSKICCSSETMRIKKFVTVCIMLLLVIVITNFPVYDFSTCKMITTTNKNQIIDHEFAKIAQYVIRENGGYYEAIKGYPNSDVGMISYGGSADAGYVNGRNAAAVIQAALDNLTDSRTWVETIAFKGNFKINSCINLPSYCMLDFGNASLTPDAHVNELMLTNNDYAEGNSQIHLTNGYLYGNSAENTGVFMIQLAGVSNFSVTNMHLEDPAFGGIWIGSNNATTYACKNFIIANNTIDVRENGHGIVTMKSASYGEIRDNVIMNVGTAAHEGDPININDECSYINVTGNSVNTSNADAITIYKNASHINVIKNTFCDCYKGIILDGTVSYGYPTYINVTSNIVNNVSAYALIYSCGSSYVNISHNIIKNGKNVSGIWVKGKCQNIVGNSLDNIGGHGIYISTGAEYAYVAGNYINRASNQAADRYRAIRVTVNYCVVENNYIFEANKLTLNFSPKTIT
jgi:hypothetical protein